MADRVQKSMDKATSNISSALHGVRGAGDAMRGSAMQALDTVVSISPEAKEGEARNRVLADQGFKQMNATGRQFSDGGHPATGQGSHFQNHATTLHTGGVDQSGFGSEQRSKAGAHAGATGAWESMLPEQKTQEGDGVRQQF